MRYCRAALVLLAAFGCQHSKPKTAAPVVQEYGLPPDEPRFNQSPPAIGPGGPKYLVGGRNATDVPTVVRPGGMMPFTGP